MAGLFRKLLTGLILLIALLFFLLPFFLDINEVIMRTAAIAVFAFGCWSIGFLPQYLTALAFFLFSVLEGLAPINVIFSGFYSKAFWLVFGGLVLGIAIKDTGLAQRVAKLLLRIMTTSYTSVLGVIVLTALFLAFFMPSTTGRVVLLVPIVVVLAERLGFKKGSSGCSGMVMAATMGCFAPSCAILPANVANMILAGTAESIYHISFDYGQYLKWHFPVLAVIKLLSIILISRWLFPAKIVSVSVSGPAEKNSYSMLEWRMTAILGITLLLWITDFLHGIAPAWVAMASAIVCFLPGVGVLQASAFREKLNFELLFFVAGVLGVASVVAYSGLGEILGEKLLRFADFHKGQDINNFFKLVAINTGLPMATTVAGLPAVATPLAQTIVDSTGFSLNSVIISQTIGYSTPLLPYQVPPILVGMQIGGVKGMEGAKMTLSVAAASIIILVPLNYLWWAYLGIFT